MAGVVYDTGALIAAERRAREFWVFHQEILLHGSRPVVPVVVLAQAWRGGPQHNLSRLLTGCRIAPDTEELGRAAGAVCGRARTSDVIDALVVVIALRLDALVAISDPEDLEHLASSLHTPLALHTF